ncbi:hypothetical protein PQX77_002717, partial [Marasmius sp. AFHP31]
MPQSQSPTLNGGTNNFAAGSGTQNNNNASGTQNNNNFTFHGPVSVQDGGSFGFCVLSDESRKVRAGPHREGFNPILYEHGQGMSPEETKLVSAWIDDHLSDNDSQVCWIHSPVGYGKTAVALTLVEREEHAASYIRGRGDSPVMIVESLVKTLELKMTGISPLYNDALQLLVGDSENPGAPDMLEKRFMALMRAAEKWSSLRQKKGVKAFLARFARVPSKKGTQSHLIVLDGLDQSNLPIINQKNILQNLLQSVQGGKCPLRFVVCTRSNPSLENFFQENPLVKRIDLQESLTPYIPDYLRSGLEAIRVNSDGLPEIWPPTEDRDALDRLVGGQLGCASDILRYLGDAHSDERACDPPQILLERLRRGQTEDIQGNVAQTLHTSPTPRLDHEYAEILRYSWPSGPVSQLVPAVLCLQEAGENSPREFIDTILDLPKAGNHLSKAAPLHAMLRIPESKDSNQNITLGRSCIEFLNDPTRSKEYFVNRQEFHNFLLQSWFGKLGKITPEQYDEKPGVVTQFWDRWAHFCVAYPGTPTKEIITSCNALDLTSLFNTALSFLWSGRRHLFCSPFLGIKTLAGWLETHITEEGVQPLVEHFKGATQTNIYLSLSRRNGAPVVERHTEFGERVADILVLGMAGCRHECPRTNALTNRAKGYLESYKFKLSVVGVGRCPEYDSGIHPHDITIGKESFLRVAKNLMAEADVSTDSEGLLGYFLNVLGSSLLSLCGNVPELLPLCERLTQTLFNTFSVSHKEEVVGCLRSVRGWLELFPPSDVHKFPGLSGLDGKIELLLKSPPSRPDLVTETKSKPTTRSPLKRTTG